MSLADIIIVIVIAALVVAAIVYEAKRRKKFKHCGSGCGGCPYAGTCSENGNNSNNRNDDS